MFSKKPKDPTITALLRVIALQSQELIKAQAEAVVYKALYEGQKSTIKALTYSPMENVN